MSDQLWINDFNILFKRDRIMEFFPTKEQTHNERINAIVRLSLYISILLAIYHSNIKFFAIFGFFLAFTSILSKDESKLKVESKGKLQIDTENKAQGKFLEELTVPHLNNFTPSLGLRVENLENEVRGDAVAAGEKCTKPTIDNPFMNFTMKDYMNLDDNGRIVDRAPACDPNDPDVKKMIDNSFSNNLYRDVSDVFGKTSSQRNYYTMPWTTVPNNRELFQNWLYLNPKTCKEDQDYCTPFEDLRNKKQILPNPEVNPFSTKKLNPANDSDSQVIGNAGSTML
jgi:hypothetical protein